MYVPCRTSCKNEGEQKDEEEAKEKIAKEDKVIPAAVSYFTISGKLLNIPTFEKDEKKRNIQLLIRFDISIVLLIVSFFTSGVFNK